MIINPACRVTMHYTLKLDDGEVLESSLEGDPIEFDLGSGQLIPGLEAALVGMSEGEEKHVVVACQDAYGPRNPAMVGQIPRDQFPPGEAVEPGMVFSLSRQDGMTMEAMVVEVNDKDVTLDLNHPLAGETLHFDVKVEKVSESKGGCGPDCGCGCSECD